MRWFNLVIDTVMGFVLCLLLVIFVFVAILGL